MSLEVLLTFIIASLILLIIPGPTILTVISYSISHGKKVKFPLICAVTLGDTSALVLSLLGLGALLASSAFYFSLLKYAGALYLLYLGFKLIKAGFTSISSIKVKNTQTSNIKLFLDTYLVTALNPKGMIFFISFLPQFINTNENVNEQLWILATTFVLLAAFNATLYAVFANKARSLLSSSTTQKIFNFAGGSLLSLAGLWALSAKAQ